MEFAGWVPAISGRLSFSTFARSDLTFKADQLSVRVAGTRDRYVIAHHTRSSNDQVLRAVIRALVPPIWRRAALGIDWGAGDKFDFILTLRSSLDTGGVRTDEILEGRAYFVIRDSDGPASSCWAAFERLRTLLGPSGRIWSASSGIDYCAEFDNETQLVLAREPNYVRPANIRLNRNGLCLVDVGTGGQGNSSFWPEDREIAAYIFMFIRDLFHRHYHHVDSDDSLIPVWPAANLVRWQQETERALYKGILEARKGRDLKAMSFADGRLAYLRAFLAAHPSSTPRSLAELSESIGAGSENIKHKTEKESIARALFIVVPFALFETCIHLVEAVDGEGNPDHPIPDGIRNLYSFVYRHVTTHWLLALYVGIITLIFSGRAIGLYRVYLWPLSKAFIRSFTYQAIMNNWPTYRSFQAIGAVLMIFTSLVVFQLDSVIVADARAISARAAQAAEGAHEAASNAAKAVAPSKSVEPSPTSSPAASAHYGQRLHKRHRRSAKSSSVAHASQ